MDSRSAPPWILAGWLLASGWLAPHSPSRLPTRIGPPTPPHELIERGTVRELRALDGLGATRAQALVNARGPRGELPRFEDIPGIGTKTAASLRAFRSQSSGGSDSGRP